MKIIYSAIFLFLFKRHSFDSIYNDYEYRKEDEGDGQNASEEYYQQSEMDDDEGITKMFNGVGF